MDTFLHQSRRPSTAEQTSGLGLFETAAPVEPAKPRPSFAPSQRKSATSKAAAESLTLSSMGEQHYKILDELAKKGGVMSRWDLHVATDIAISALCARLGELQRAPASIEVVEGACFSHAKATLRVDGYRITDAGRSRVREVTP